MKKDYVLSIDQSTSGTKILLINRNGEIIAKVFREHKQYYPSPGWVEHDPVEIYENIKELIRNIFSTCSIEPSDVAVLTITNQRETAVMWDKVTGQPLYNAIVWQCQRTADLCEAHRSAGHEPKVREATGLMLDPYFTATKWAWILEHVAEAQQKLVQGTLLAGTMDSWIVWKLTGGMIHATDYSNASRTSLFNINTLQWDEEMCELFQVPIRILPQVKHCDDIFGYTKDLEVFTDPIPISGVIGDSQGALFGQQCIRPGMAKATYGTGTSLMMNIGDKPVQGGDGLVTTIAWGADGHIVFAAEAVIRTTGDALKWIQDNLGLFQTFEEMQRLMASVSDTDGVYLVPAFVGLGAPYWNPNVRAAFMGMNRRTNKGHLVRAAIESIAYQVTEAVQLMQRELGVELNELFADGGASDNADLMQFQADMLNAKVNKSTITELSAMGSAYLGGAGINFWSIQDIAKMKRSYLVSQPKMDHETRMYKLNGWKLMVYKLLVDVTEVAR